MKKDVEQHEVRHGKWLAAADPESVWGWGSPAGRFRAARRAEMILRNTGLRPGKTVLEIGCGTGLFTAYFARSGARLTAVDISPELISKAQERGLSPEQVRFVEGSFDECVLEGPFDAVIGSSVLHHLDIRPALQKIIELLKPGGRLSFAEPNMLNPQIMMQKNIPWIRKKMGDSPDETAFFSWQMRSLLEEAGFCNICVTPFDWLHPAVPESLIGTVLFLGAVLERIPVIRLFAGSLHIAACRPLALRSEMESLP
jgi:SAM-dependent methyltransferase